MKNKFTIGEISKLHNIPVKTLRYYDEIGLFKPIEINEKTGYRYYSIEQFEHLNTINYLKYLGIPLKEIKEHLDRRNIDLFLDLLKKQKKITENKIKELTLIKNQFDNRIKEMEAARNITNTETVILKKLQERKVLRLKEKIGSEPELELSLRKLENKSNIHSTIIIGKVGLTIALDNIKKNKFDQYNSIFILIEEAFENYTMLETLKAGEYACIYHRGNHQESPKYYKILIDYIHQNHYEMIGDSIERTILDQFISDKRSDYLTEIQIPVKKS